MCQADDGANCEDGVAPEGAIHLSEGDGAMERGEAYWTYDAEAGAWYFGLNSRAAPPYLTQRHFDAIVDLDADGRLVGIELLQPLLPSRSPIEEATSVADEFTPCAIELDEARITEMVLKDCFMIWEPWGNDGVEFGYDAEGSLQAIRIPDLVAGHKVLSERGQSPKGGDGEAGSVHAHPVPEGNSPDPAANKSASLTPQNLEAKAREIVENGPVIFGRESMAHYEAAILAALREERERAAKIAERLAYSNQATPYLGPELNCLRVAAAIRGEDNGC